MSKKKEVGEAYFAEHGGDLLEDLQPCQNSDLGCVFARSWTRGHAFWCDCRRDTDARKHGPKCKKLVFQSSASGASGGSSSGVAALVSSRGSLPPAGSHIPPPEPFFAGSAQEPAAKKARQTF